MENDKTKLIGKQAAFLALIETGLGSILHGMHIPLSGHFLSLNQIAFMARASSKFKSKEAPVKISMIASLLKSLSPAGKKLTPMLAILAQGFLFTTGLSLFGLNIIGYTIASILSALWAIIQPALILFILFGENLIKVVEHFNLELQKVASFDLKWLLPLFFGFILVKVNAALLVCFLAIRADEEQFENWQNKLIKEVKPKAEGKKTSPVLGALKDLCTPLFLFSLGLTVVFFLYSQSSKAQLIWGILRPVAVGFILFYVVRVYPIENIAKVFEKLGWKDFAHHFREAVLTIKNQREK